MDQLDYQIQLKVKITAEQIIKGISHVAGWWAQEVDGTAAKTGDQFTVHFGKTWGTFRVDELAENRIVWSVTDCYLDLLKNTKEWNGTRIIFRLNRLEDQMVIDITHEGLAPDKECFSDCTKGWNFYFGESLFGYLEKQQGFPGTGIHAWLETDGRIFKGKLYTGQQLSTEMSGDLLLLEVAKTKGEQVLSAYAVRAFEGEAGPLRGTYYMLLNNEPDLLDQLQNFVSQTIEN